MVAARNPYIQSAYEQLQIISQDKQKRLEYEAREKAIRDYNQSMYEAQRRGHKQGLQEGHKQGLQEGHKQGLQEGHKQGLQEGHKQGLQEGLQKGVRQELINLIQKKIEKNKTLEQIADDLEKSVDEIIPLYNQIKDIL